MRLIIAVLMLMLMWTLAGCQSDSSIEGILFGDNLKVILEYGGVPAVILLFGYLYLRSILRENSIQLGRMQEQLNNQQIAMNTLIQNNTKALTRLGTAMMMGCPLIRKQLDGKEADDEEEGNENTE